MIITAVMAEVGTALATIDKTRVYAGAPPKIDVPSTGAAIVVPYPDRIDYDGTYGRGMDTIDQPIVVVLGRPTDRETADRLVAFASGSGASSVKAVLEGYAWTTCHGIRVARAAFDVVQIGGVDYMAGEWTTEIWGQGG